MPTISNLSFNVRFNLTGTPTLVLTDTSASPPAGLVGIFAITQPDGYVRTGNIDTPDISAAGGSFSYTLRLNSSGGLQSGTYKIVYTANAPSYLSTDFTREFVFTYQAPELILTEDFDVFTPLLRYIDSSTYTKSGYTNGAITRAWTAVSIPTGTITGSSATFNIEFGGEYYDANYNVGLTSSLLYTNTTYNWLTVQEVVTKSVSTYAQTPPSITTIIGEISDLKLKLDQAINTCQVYDGIKADFEYAQTLFQHIFDKIRFADMDNIYEDLKELLTILNNYQIPVYTATNLPIQPYDISGINYPVTRSSQTFTATAGQTVFTTTYPFQNNLFDLFLNGVKLNISSYNTLGEYQITLVDGCSVGDIVDVVIYDPTASIIPNPVTSWGTIIGALSNQTDLQSALNGKFNNPTGTISQYIRGDGSLATLTASSVWGNITGTLSNQTDLQNALNSKYNNPTGTTSQYIRGDGQLANFPDNQGGGSSVNYYLNGSVTQGTFGGDTYYEMSKNPVLGAGTNFTRTNAQGNGYIASFITDAGDPSLLNIPAGNWNVEFYFQANSNAGNPQFYAELYKVDASNNFTLVGSGSTNPEGITNGTTIDQYYTAIPVPQTSLLVTDRLAIRIFVITSGRTITLHTENSNLCEVITTLSTGLNALNGLTAQVQYFATGTSGTDFAISSATDTHTFNLPTASATNRGALSSADWTSFNNKISGTATAGQVAYFTGATTQAGSNNLFWDNTNGRLGIGITTPLQKLHIVDGAIQLTDSFPIRWGTTNLLYGSATALDISSTAFAVRFRFTTGGNFLINSTTDSGQRLQVTGDTLLKGSGNTSATTALTVQNSASTTIFSVRNDGFTIAGGLNTNYLRFASITSNCEIFSQDGQGTATTGASAGQSFRSSLTATGTDFIFGNGQGANNQTSGGQGFLSINRGFNPTSGTATYSLFAIGSTINQTGGANGITRGLYVNPTLTDAADWRSIEWSNNSGWGLYGAGTANNYLAGNLTIGSTLAFGKIYVGGVTGGGYSDGTFVFSQPTLNGNITNFFNYRSAIIPSGTVTITNVLHYAVSQAAIGTTTITNQYGVNISSNMIGGTNNYGFFGDIPSGTNRWNLYMNGTAANYLNGSLGIGSTSINASAKLQVDTITQGFLPPRMTTVQKLAITSPATGLQVYDTTLNLMSFYNGTAWVTGGGGGSQILNFPILCASGSWGAGTTYNFGATTSAADTSGNRNRGVFNKAGVIKSVTIVFRATNAPASANNPISLKTATGNGTMSVVASTTFDFNGQSVFVFTWTGLNISVSQNDTYEFTITPQVGATNALITGHIEVQLT
jgi:hypothetical protein